MPDSKNPILQTLLNLVSDRNTLTVHRAVVDFLDGHFEAALLLEQLLYWTPRASRRGGWIAKSYAEWREEIYLSRYAIEKERKYLQKRGLLEWEIRRFKNSPTAFYRLNLDELASQWEAFIHEREAETALGEGGSSEEAEKAPAEIDRCPEEPSKAPAEISKCPDETPKAPAEISKPPAEIDRSPAEISKSLTEITTEITQLSINARLQQQASTTRNRREPAPPAAAAASSAVVEAELPEEITAGLKAIGWRGPVDTVVRYWQADPDRVENLVWYAQQAGWGGGLLRNALRSGEWPPELKPDSPAAWRAIQERYLNDPYAEFYANLTPNSNEEA